MSKYSETISKIKVKPMPIQINTRKAPFCKWSERKIKGGRMERSYKGLKEGEKR